MNKNGFTLVELLATLAILSIIMIIAIPNVMSILDKNKRTVYIEDAKKLQTLAEYEFTRDTTINRPNASNCVKIRLSYLDKTDLSTGPNDGTYDVNQSFVVIRYDGSKYTYQVQLVENYSGKKKGVKLTSYDSLLAENASKTLIATSGFSSQTCTVTK